jgi:hypothetical protein
MSGEDVHHHDDTKASIMDTIPATLLKIMENKGGSMS